MTTTPDPYTHAMSWQESLRIGLRTMLGRAYPRLISAVREREWLFYEVALPLLRIIVFVLTLVALYGLGSMLASLYLLYNREVWVFQEMIQEPISLVTGFYFPIRTLGGLVGGAASLIPLTLGLDAMRQLLFPQGWPAFLPVGW